MNLFVILRKVFGFPGSRDFFLFHFSLFYNLSLFYNQHPLDIQTSTLIRNSLFSSLSSLTSVPSRLELDSLPLQKKKKKKSTLSSSCP